MVDVILTINKRQLYIHIDILSKYIRYNKHPPSPACVALHLQGKNSQQSWNGCVCCSIPSTKKPPLTETSARRGQSLRLMERWRRRCEKHLWDKSSVKRYWSTSAQADLQRIWSWETWFPSCSFCYLHFHHPFTISWGTTRLLWMALALVEVAQRTMQMQLPWNSDTTMTLKLPYT